MDPGETLFDADRVIVGGRRRRPRGLPRGGFILAVTNRRFIALAASRWLAHPGEVLTTWSYDEGYALASAPFGRVHLVLPDRSVVTLRPYGGRRISHLAAKR